MALFASEAPPCLVVLGPAAGRPTLQMPCGGAGIGLGFSENLSPRTHIARFFFPPSFFPSFTSASLDGEIL